MNRGFGYIELYTNAAGLPNHHPEKLIAHKNNAEHFTVNREILKEVLTRPKATKDRETIIPNLMGIF